MFGNLTNFTTESINTSSEDTFTNNTSTGILYTTTTTTTETPNSPEDLIWILPAVLGTIFFLFAVACVLFHTIKQFEICVLKFSYKHFGCCGPPPENEQRKRRSYTELKEKEDSGEEEVNVVYMKGNLFSIQCWLYSQFCVLNIKYTLNNFILFGPMKLV